MTPEKYRRVYNWFGRHPMARRLVIGANRWLPAVPFVCYPILLCLACGQAVQGQVLRPVLQAVLVPGITFCAGTALRAALNAPRPYEQAGFVPLVEKETRGRSFPSRHALSAAVLAAVWLWFYPAVGVVMVVIAALICVLRVLTGAHFVRDVVAGAALGFACGMIGMVAF